MLSKYFSILGLFFLSLHLSAQQQVNIIPQPVSLHLNNGSFIIDNKTSLKFNASGRGLKEAARFFSGYIESVSGINLLENASVSKGIELKLEKIPGIGKEGYLLTVTPFSIIISANTTTGIIYGMQSLFQTLPAVRTNAALTVPCLEIKDYPRFKWRGMHLDVSRHFFSPELVREYIDLMAAYKFNTFHWHLTDDQGWRIEIKKYPKLTLVGGWRVDHTDLVWGQRPQAVDGEAPTYGGYYTQQQVKEIVAYAAQRNVTIVPELDVPGHSAAAIAAYPFLSCTQQPQLPLTGGNYIGMTSNLCPGNDSVYMFLQDVYSEVMNLFPAQYIHIGGDEVDKAPWKKCTKCQARIKAENLKDEEELQSYFIKRMEKFIVSKYRKMIGWDEILEGGLAPEATVMSWRGETGGIAAAKMNHNVVMTPGNPVYFDHYQGDPVTEPLAIGGFNTLKKVYEYEPISKELDENQAKFVLGAQANLWTEFITTAEQVEYMVLPRMLALAEVVWSPKEKRNWNSFNNRLQSHFKAFDQKGRHYSKGNFKVDIKPASQNGQLFATLSTEAYNGYIYYTTDDSQPTLQSKKYTEPVLINSSLVLKAVTVVNDKIMSVVPAQQSFVMHKAIGKNVTYKNAVSRYYMADGPNSLTDGIRGTNVIGKHWHGFSGKDLIATIDLGETKNIQTITLGCLQNYNDWVFLPQSVKFETSANGTDFEEVQIVSNPLSINENKLQFDFKATFPAKAIKYVRITAKNNLCPPGHGGEGKPGWIFVDEIIVE